MPSGVFSLKQQAQARSEGAWPGSPPTTLNYLVVAGGGAGGTERGGGGGAGGLLQGNIAVIPGTSYTVTIGAGGTQTGYNVGGNGSNSVFGSLTAIGGGGGAYSSSTTPSSGGSGGGGGGADSAFSAGAQGTSGQGNRGADGTGGANPNNSGGGGGGAGTAGIKGVNDTGGNGGAGIASDISGARVVYAGGGGGGSNPSQGSGGTGGVGGGGNGGAVSTAPGTGGANTGGGGGGDERNNNGGSGGSGIVIVSYPGTTQWFTGGTLSYANGNVIHTFYTSGTLAPTAPSNFVNTDYQISRSLRFNSADSAYLNRTPASSSNLKTWTWSSWVKRSAFTTLTYYEVFAAAASSATAIYFYNDVFYFQITDSGGTVIGNVSSAAVFRDPSAWYHIVAVLDTTQATGTNRVKLYVNNVEQTLTFTTTPSQNSEARVNSSSHVHYVGGRSPYNFNGYMADVHFIDGSALTPSSFGENDTDTGVWKPKAYTGSYGTNGFKLTFSDNSGTTSTTLGKDTSGNGNNWTPNNFSVTAGAGNDSLVDTPTPYGTDTGAGGQVRGNYATLNPLNTGNTLTLSNGNLYAGRTNANNSQYYTAASTFAVNSGKWYWEVYADFVVSAPGQWSQLGIVTSTISNFSNAAIGYSGALSSAYAYYNDGSKAGNGTATAGYGATFTTGDTIGVAFDADAGTITFYKNGVSQGQAFSGISMTNAWSPVFQLFDGTSGTTHGFFLNAGQRPFAYTAPSGFKALCTTNLPTPTIGATSSTRAGKYFNTVLYTGTGATQSITGVGFQPDFVWLKSRSNGVRNHRLYDVIRGTTKELYSSTTDQETTDANGLTAFNSDGFTVGSSVGVNENTATMVGWNWKANGAGSSNTAGSIISTVSANTTAGFSIVTFTSQSSGTGTVGHGLGVSPSMIITKSRAVSGSWTTYHASLGNTQLIYLDLTSAAATDGSVWNNTSPTSSVFTLGTGFAGSISIVAYCFAPVAGYSAFGSYTGNGNADGPMVFTGFRPKWIMIKRTDTTSSWAIYDSVRDTYNVVMKQLNANLSDAEYTDGADLDFVSNGFKIRRNPGQINASGGTYIYMAVAENPFKYSLAR